VAAREKRGQGFADDILMADDYLADLGFGARESAPEFGNAFGWRNLRGPLPCLLLVPNRWMPSALYSVDQIAIAWRHKLTFLGVASSRSALSGTLAYGTLAVGRLVSGTSLPPLAETTSVGKRKST